MHHVQAIIIIRCGHYIADSLGISDKRQIRYGGSSFEGNIESYLFSRHLGEHVTKLLPALRQNRIMTCSRLIGAIMYLPKSTIFLTYKKWATLDGWGHNIVIRWCSEKKIWKKNFRKGLWFSSPFGLYYYYYLAPLGWQSSWKWSSAI